MYGASDHALHVPMVTRSHSHSLSLTLPNSLSLYLTLSHSTSLSLVGHNGDFEGVCTSDNGYTVRPQWKYAHNGYTVSL